MAEHRDRLSSVASLTGGTVHHETTEKSLAKEGKHSQVNRILTRAGNIQVSQKYLVGFPHSLATF